jgi:hypothetical protein
MTKFDVTCRAVGGNFSTGKRDLAPTSRPHFNPHGRHPGDRLSRFVFFLASASC